MVFTGADRLEELHRKFTCTLYPTHLESTGAVASQTFVLDHRYESVYSLSYKAVQVSKT